MNILEHISPTSEPKVVSVHTFEDEQIAIGYDRNGKEVARMPLEDYEQAKLKIDNEPLN